MLTVAASMIYGRRWKINSLQRNSTTGRFLTPGGAGATDTPTSSSWSYAGREVAVIGSVEGRAEDFDQLFSEETSHCGRDEELRHAEKRSRDQACPVVSEVPLFLREPVLGGGGSGGFGEVTQLRLV